MNFCKLIMFSILLHFLFYSQISFAQEEGNDLDSNSKGVYKGESRKGKKHGKGIFTWENGGKYEGSWRNNLMHGYGVYISAKGDTYRGMWLDGQMYGQGTFRWKNGTKYEGYFRFGKRSGSGKLTFADGSSHDGLWKNGMSNGYGKHTWASGSQYIGDWKNDKRHGRGVMIYRDGKIEQGNWEDDKYIACRCEVTVLPVAKAYEQSEAVFVGRVVTITDDFGYDAVKMQVSTYWKGELSYSRYITVTAAYSSCDQIYQEGESYLVYATKSLNGYSYVADKCSRTNILKAATRDIELLKSLVPCGEGEKKSSISGEKDPVCGCDGIVYKNPSEAKKAGVAYWQIGKCD